MLDRTQLVEKFKADAVETPYAVEETEKGVRVTLDIADVKWYTLFYKNGLDKTFYIDVMMNEDKHQARTRATSYRLEWQAGVEPGTFVPQVSGKISTQRGLVMEKSFEKGYGMSEDGEIGEVYSWTFDSSEISGWVDEILKQAGWKKAWPIEAIVALGMAILGGGGAIVALVVLAIVKLM